MSGNQRRLDTSIKLFPVLWCWFWFLWNIQPVSILWYWFPIRVTNPICIQFFAEYCKVLSLLAWYRSLDPSRLVDLHGNMVSILDFFAAYGVISFSLSRIDIPINILLFAAFGLSNWLSHVWLDSRYSIQYSSSSSCWWYFSWWCRWWLLSFSFYRLLPLLLPPAIQPSFL